MFDEKHHIGQLIVNCWKKRPNDVCQIDASTGQQETNASVMRRSLRFATWLRQRGYGPGDVMALGGIGHLDLHIPYYAAVMNSMTITGIDPLFKLPEVKTFFKLTEPKIAFCESENFNIYETAAKDLALDTKVVRFSGDNSLHQLIAEIPEDVGEIEPIVIDQEKQYLWLVATGGTTGVFKVAAITYRAFMDKLNFLYATMPRKDKTGSDTGYKVTLNVSAIQWISGLFFALVSPLRLETKLMTSAPATTDHVIDIINKYRPVSGLLSPSPATAILKSPRHCDLTCFAALVLTGGKIYSDIYTEFKKRSPNLNVIQAYGQTENLGSVHLLSPLGPQGSCGRGTTYYKLKLVDPETGKEITEPNVPGELWTKGIAFTEYYRNPEETAKAFTTDGWFKTGDILYRDEDDYYFFVERTKMLIKYRNYQIVPPELEEVLRTHPGVLEVYVTSIPHEDDGEHPVACVVRRPGCDVTATQLKKLIADNFSDTQQLRGGVVFVDDMPKTSVGKIARHKLRELALSLPRENP